MPYIVDLNDKLAVSISCIIGINVRLIYLFPMITVSALAYVRILGCFEINVRVLQLPVIISTFPSPNVNNVDTVFVLCLCWVIVKGLCPTRVRTAKKSRITISYYVRISSLIVGMCCMSKQSTF